MFILDKHQIWELKDGESLRSWFENAFPRMPFKKNDGLVTNQEWDRLAKANGTRFPPCQYSPGLSVTSLDGTCGVALVGDAGKKSHSVLPQLFCRETKRTLYFHDILLQSMHFLPTLVKA